MCKCTPGIRTPFCGKSGCEWPKQEGVKDIKIDISQFKAHFKLELDIHANIENMQSVLETIMENIRNEFEKIEDKTEVIVKPTLTVIEKPIMKHRLNAIFGEREVKDES